VGNPWGSRPPSGDNRRCFNRLFSQLCRLNRSNPWRRSVDTPWGCVREGCCRKKGRDTLLKIASRFSSAVVRDTHDLLLANSEAPTCRLASHLLQGTEAWGNLCRNLSFVGPNPISMAPGARQGQSPSRRSFGGVSGGASTAGRQGISSYPPAAPCLSSASPAGYCLSNQVVSKRIFNP
jgi:hypothetical protein